ncbi:SHOCT domain-containing protein [Cryobacterium fucosi]|uniref:SHOCT domain-containing protein n=2 Tax=Cryobacterium fucosi TaxID=1259157 RepID=A0A4R9BEI7_9MICO|nr:SHOCT domain-containing protein [Cryobacterium fucosi]
MMYGWYGGDWGIGAWIAMALMMLVFWGGVVTVVVLLLRRTHTSEGSNLLRPSHHDAERILNERFARGEIDEEEYSTRRAALRRPE